MDLQNLFPRLNWQPEFNEFQLKPQTPRRCGGIQIYPCVMIVVAEHIHKIGSPSRAMVTSSPCKRNILLTDLKQQALKQTNYILYVHL